MVAKSKSSKANKPGARKPSAVVRSEPVNQDKPRKSRRPSWLTIVMIVFVVAVVGLGIFFAAVPDTGGGATTSPTATMPDTSPSPTDATPTS